MTSADLSREQYDKLAKRVHPMWGYLHRLHIRASETLDPDDELLRLISEAEDAAHGLWVHCHYGSCGMTGEHTIRPLPYPTPDASE